MQWRNACIKFTALFNLLLEGGGGGARRSWNWMMHYRQPLFALNPWSTVLLCREHNILTILLWNKTVYMYMCDLYIFHLVRVVFLLQKRFFLPLIACGIASVKFYLKAICFVFHTTVRSPWFVILVQKVLSKQASSWNLIGLTKQSLANIQRSSTK